jgi:hypothetical protein
MSKTEKLLKAIWFALKESKKELLNTFSKKQLKEFLHIVVYFLPVLLACGNWIIQTVLWVNGVGDSAVQWISYGLVILSIPLNVLWKNFIEKVEEKLEEL